MSASVRIVELKARFSRNKAFSCGCYLLCFTHCLWRHLYAKCRGTGCVDLIQVLTIVLFNISLYSVGRRGIDVWCSIPIRGSDLLSFLRSNNKRKRGAEFRHSIRNVSKMRQNSQIYLRHFCQVYVFKYINIKDNTIQIV